MASAQSPLIQFLYQMPPSDGTGQQHRNFFVRGSKGRAKERVQWQWRDAATWRPLPDDACRRLTSTTSGSISAGGWHFDCSALKGVFAGMRCARQGLATPTCGESVDIRRAPPDVRETTHLLLDGRSGGKICVPPERNDAFLAAYAKHMDMGLQAYFVECRTTHFKFLTDLDIMEEEGEVPLRGDGLSVLSMVRIMQRAARKFYTSCDDDVFVALVCCAPSKRVSKGQSEGLVKTGVHVVMPRLVVDSERALLIRATALEMLRERFGPRHARNDWDDVVDDHVLVGCGLRMLLSNKMSRCSQCKNRPDAKADCSHCDDWGRVDEGRAYHLTAVLDGAGDEDAATQQRMASCTAEAVVASSIRTWQPLTEPFARWSGAPSSLPYKPVKGRGTKRSGAPQQLVRQDTFPEDSRTEARMRKLVSVDLDSPQAQAAIRMARRVHEAYKETRFNEVLRTTAGAYIVKPCVGSVGSSTCLNKMPDAGAGASQPGMHSSNTIYFMIEPTGAHQRCRCTCKTTEGRRGIECSRFRSHTVPLVASAMDVLYGEARASDMPSAAAARAAKARLQQERVQSARRGAQHLMPQSGASKRAAPTGAAARRARAQRAMAMLGMPSTGGAALASTACTARAESPPKRPRVIAVTADALFVPPASPTSSESPPALRAGEHKMPGAQ